jgi:hypothetical protein
MCVVAVNVLEVLQFQTGRFNTGAAVIASSGSSIGVKRVFLGILQTEQTGKLLAVGEAVNTDTVTYLLHSG